MGSHREKFSLRDLCSKGRAFSPRRALTRLIADEQGQAILEYMLILSATVVGAGLISRKILDTVDKGILQLGGQLEKDLKTGRLPLDVWKN